MDSHTKTLIKTFSWRAIATIILFCIVWAFTGQVVLGLEIGAVDIVVKMIFYYIHERVWVRFKF